MVAITKSEMREALKNNFQNEGGQGKALREAHFAVEGRHFNM